MTPEENTPILQGTSQRKPCTPDWDRNLPPEPHDTKEPNGNLLPKDDEVGKELHTEAKSSKKFSFLGLSSAKKRIFVLLCVANFATTACFSLLGPFFPTEAAAKGMSESLTGFVFSCFELWFFLMSPVYGNYLVRIGPRFAFIAGLFATGGFSIPFGTLNLVPGEVPFVTLAILLRTAMALGASANVTASYALVANSFPDHISVVFAALEVFSGLGYMLGPPLGGGLYSLGGFGLPFYSTGLFLIVWSMLSFFVLPRLADTAPGQKSQASVWNLLGSPLVLICCVNLMFANYTFGFLDASFAFHMEQFHLSAWAIGLCLMTAGGVYTLSACVCGWLSDTKNINSALLMISGNGMVSVFLLLIGPSPLLPFVKADLSLVVISLLFIGCGTGMIIIPIIKVLYTAARRRGFQDGFGLDALLSGLLNSSLHFGTFLGPTIGSSVMEATSYEWSATLNAAFNFLALVLLLIHELAMTTCLKHKDKEKSQLLPAPKRTVHPDDLPPPSCHSTEKGEN